MIEFCCYPDFDSDKMFITVNHAFIETLFLREELKNLEYVLDFYIEEIGLYPTDRELHSKIEKLCKKIKELI